MNGIERTPDGTIVCTGNGVRLAQLIAWKHAIKLEMKGIKVQRKSITAIVKRHFGWKGSRTKILEQLETHIQAQLDSMNNPAV